MALFLEQFQVRDKIGWKVELPRSPAPVSPASDTTSGGSATRPGRPKPGGARTRKALRGARRPEDEGVDKAIGLVIKNILFTSTNMFSAVIAKYTGILKVTADTSKKLGPLKVGCW